MTFLRSVPALRWAAGAFVALTLAVSAFSRTAFAESLGDRLGQARVRQQRVNESLMEMQARLDVLQSRLERRQDRLDRAIQRYLLTADLARDASLQVLAVQDSFDRRVRMLYEMGPLSSLDMLFAAQNISDLLSINEYAGRTLDTDSRALEDLRQARADLAEQRARAAAQQARLIRGEEEVRALVEAMEVEVRELEDRARAAGTDVAALEEEKRAIERARERAIERAREIAEQQAEASAASSPVIIAPQGLDPSGAPDPALPSGPVPDPGSFDQDRLLALLGPTGGRTCHISPGLRNTGVTVSGYASWYGEPQGTASGVPFDPSLFTAAHRTLPMGTFLRVHHGSRCAIVLINDRGPYGHYERVVDLSRAAAMFLHVGVSPITAEVLVPA